MQNFKIIYNVFVPTQSMAITKEIVVCGKDVNVDSAFDEWEKLTPAQLYDGDFDFVEIEEIYNIK